MEQAVPIYFKSKVDWWFYLVGVIVLIPIGALLFIPGYNNLGFDSGLRTSRIVRFAVILIYFVLVIVLANSNVYCISGDQLGVRSFFKWKWYSIDRIQSVREVSSSARTGVIATSFSRVRIIFKTLSSRNSSQVIELSPRDRDKFIEEVKAVNPSILVMKN